MTANFIQTFFDRLSTSGDALLLAGAVNIHIERAIHTTADEVINLLACYDLVQHVTDATHDAGGTIDVVCTRRDLPPPTVDVIDVGLSLSGTIVCYGGRRGCISRRLSTLAASGNRSMLQRSAPTCQRLRYVMSDI